MTAFLEGQSLILESDTEELIHEINLILKNVLEDSIELVEDRSRELDSGLTGEIDNQIINHELSKMIAKIPEELLEQFLNTSVEDIGILTPKEASISDHGRVLLNSFLQELELSKQFFLNINYIREILNMEELRVLNYYNECS